MMSKGRLKLGDVMRQARKGDETAIRQIFAGFLASGETVVGCGYLGALGYILPEHSFWCVTDKRVCGLLIRAGGRVNFRSGFLDLVNTVSFSQPSLIHLWLYLFVYLVFLVAVSLGGAGLLTQLVIMIGYEWFSLPLWDSQNLIGIVSAALIFLFGLYMMRWVVRIFYRLVKSGCTFWTREKLPVFVFADRNNLRAAQNFMQIFAEEKRQYR